MLLTISNLCTKHHVPALQYVQQYLHRGQVIKTKNDYRSGQDRLELWLENAELILTATNDCSVEAIKEYGEKLNVSIVQDNFIGKE